MISAVVCLIAIPAQSLLLKEATYCFGLIRPAQTESGRLYLHFNFAFADITILLTRAEIFPDDTKHNMLIIVCVLMLYVKLIKMTLIFDLYKTVMVNIVMVHYLLASDILNKEQLILLGMLKAWLLFILDILIVYLFCKNS